MRICDWSSDLCSSDPGWRRLGRRGCGLLLRALLGRCGVLHGLVAQLVGLGLGLCGPGLLLAGRSLLALGGLLLVGARLRLALPVARSEEHTSELQSLMRISYAVFCLKKKTQT